MTDEEKLLVKTLDCQDIYIEDTKVTKVQFTTKEAKILFNLINKQQKEIEELRNPVICGRNIDEIVNILMALDIEKQYKIEVTMENLKSLMGIYQSEVEKSIRDAQIKIIDDLTGSGCKINFTLPHYNFDGEIKV